MAIMNVSLPESMKDWVEAQTQTGRYSTTSDYLHDLIRRDQEHACELAKLQSLITEGFESGLGDRSIAEILDAARGQAKAMPR